MSDTNPRPEIPGEQASLVEYRPRLWPGAFSTTSDAAVDRIMGSLTGLAERPTPEHVAVYAQLHDELLAELDAETDGA